MGSVPSRKIPGGNVRYSEGKKKMHACTINDQSQTDKQNNEKGNNFPHYTQTEKYGRGLCEPSLQNNEILNHHRLIECGLDGFVEGGRLFVQQ